MKEIKLTQGKIALVSDEDYEYLSQFKWHAHKEGRSWYALRSQRKKQKRIAMHRVVAKRSGADLSNLIDHIDRNGLNNQRENLRPATYKQNNENASVRRDNKSGFRGVGWYKRLQKWYANIGHNGKLIHLGCFDDIEDAIKARKEAEERYFTLSEVQP